MNTGKTLFIYLLFAAGIAIVTEPQNGNLPFTNKIRHHFASSQYEKIINL